MLEKEQKIFKEYVNNFSLKDENILKKYEHSLRVMNLTIEIAKDLNLETNEIQLIGLVGLLHDIGRFEQWEKYHTYVDSISIDHGNVGVEILKKDNYINNYIQDENSKEKLYLAIRNHNKIKIEDNMDFNTQIITKIVRDADKLDIMQTQGMNRISSNIVLKKEQLDNIYKKQCCIVGEKNNEADYIIRQICFIFDFNYNYSFKYIKANKIIQHKIMLLKNNCPKELNLSEVEQFLIKYINLNENTHFII